MGLKCSLFGHAYDERDVVRERESKGSEVVTVVKDVERCAECGTTRVVSTNKEVVAAATGPTADGGVDSGPSLQPPGTDESGGPETAGGAGSVDQSGTGSDAADAGFAAATDDTTTDALAADAADDGGAELLTGDSESGADAATDDAPTDAAAADAATTPTADESATDESSASPDEQAGGPDPETEDAEILTDEPQPDRAPGQWPGDEAGEAWEPQPLTDDAAADAPAAETAAADAPDTETADSDEPATENADADADADGASAPAGPRGAAAATEGETPDTTAEPAPDLEHEPAATASFTVPEGHYRCPECGHTIPAESSFRRGDACPECIHGYLESSS
ncbi:MAG: hypothetical protein ABEJ05_03200 [Haloglomus sp.]